MIDRALWLAPVVASLLWASVAAPSMMVSASVSRMAERIAAGDHYAVEALDKAAEIGGHPTGFFCSERRLRDTLLIRSRLAELALSAGAVTEVDERFLDVRRAAAALLSCSPGQAVGWIALFWVDLQNGRAGTAETQEMLRRSYRFGPHEFWVQVRRNPLAMATYDRLAPDLRSAALGEFAEILKAGGFPQAASILVGPGSQLVATLRERIAPLPDYTRRMLAMQLRAMGSDIVVPGVEARDPRWR